MARWNGKHPIPWDFFNTFNNVSGQNLDRFWNNWYFNNGYIDLAASRVTETAAGYSLVVDNIGGMAAPFDGHLQFSDGTTQVVHQTPAVWKANTQRPTVTLSIDPPLLATVRHSLQGMTRSYLGEFEHLVLLAVLRLGDTADARKHMRGAPCPESKLPALARSVQVWAKCAVGMVY